MVSFLLPVLLSGPGDGGRKARKRRRRRRNVTYWQGLWAETASAGTASCCIREASEEKLLLPADDIIDLREINDEQILELTEPILNERNRYLIAVAVTETQEGRRIPAYILDPACLSGEQ